jgi:membrane protein DedA with SNARE-associated domain
MIAFITQIVSYLLSLVEKLGYTGIFIGMTIESSFFPLPSELILIPAGALISQGKMSFSITIFFAILGSIFGALINYVIALSLGRRAIESLVSKYGKVFLISKNELDKTDIYFHTHGEVTTFVGRLLPGIRHLISLPAGFSKMNLNRFCLFTALGAGFWSMILIYAGWLANRHQAFIAKHPILITIFLIIISIIIISSYIIFIRRQSKKSK